MDAELNSIGYIFKPSKYSPALGYSRLKTVISGKPTQRFFDVKLMQISTFDGLSFHQTKITRHELEPSETFQVCLGEWRLETYQGESLLGFSLGGNLRVAVEMGDLYCDFTSNAPIFMEQDDPDSVSGVIADEIEDLVAENESKLAGHEDELYARLSHFDPYQVFLSCLVSLKKRADSVPLEVRRERFHKVSASINRAIQIVRDTDGWDGNSSSLEELLSNGGASENKVE
jgi:hypothetical protein